MSNKDVTKVGCVFVLFSLSVISPIVSADISPRFPVDGLGWYHHPNSAGHFPSGGVGCGGTDGEANFGGWDSVRGIDDTYALDLNHAKDDKDPPDPVSAIANGRIRQLVTNVGWVLIEHSGTVSWKGRSYSKWFSAYLHMEGIPSSLNAGKRVTKGQRIGNVGNKSAAGTHLHFGIYVGRIVKDPDVSDEFKRPFKRCAQNAYLQSVDPGAIAGSAFKGFKYGDNLYDEWVDDSINHDSTHSFSKNGSQNDWGETHNYGFYPSESGRVGHMLYTRTREQNKDNIGVWRHKVSKHGNYGVFVFIPRNYANTTNARYQISVNGECLKTDQGNCKEWVVNQSKYFDTWVPLGTADGFDFTGDQIDGLEQGEGRFSFSAGDVVKVRLSDKTGEPAGSPGCDPGPQCHYVGYDAIRFIQKQDTRMEQVLDAGTDVITTGELNVRTDHCTTDSSCPKKPIRNSGTAGTVIQGPERSDGFDWYKIRYDDGVTGWSALTGRLKRFTRPSRQFAVGNPVQTTRELPVRQAPCTDSNRCPLESTSPLPEGTAGTIISFDEPHPRVVDGSRWWKVRYEDGTEGWSVEDGLELTGSRPETEHLTLQEAVARGFVELKSKGEFFGDGVTFIGTGQNSEDVIVEVRVGDIILTKDPNRQDLAVTQDQDILLPAGEEVRKEGIWIACLDQGKSAPQNGQELDVTSNLAEWPQQLAHRLLEKLQEQEGNITQEAVWKISDREDFPEVSNPERASQDSSFTVSPQLTLTSIIAKHIENCPKAKSNPDTIICRKEIKFATWLYYSNQAVPGTTGRKITLEKLRKMVSFYVTQTPTNHPPAGANNQQVEAQLEKLLGQQRPNSLSVSNVTVAPNPIRHLSTVQFTVLGTAIESVKIDIYDLSGTKIFSSDQVMGSTFTWHLQDDHGNVVANGVYLYLVTVRGVKGQVVRSEVRKMVVLR